ncbi:unnamed protein product [Nezara viridula]|uniref:Uncharacterized protein n=1 Tax=Nezara viridula TaxID=85310 RepID=A0A9P0H3L6_NEZVI|nr:unnamed protein product [Nezara viridula]
MDCYLNFDDHPQLECNQIAQAVRLAATAVSSSLVMSNLFLVYFTPCLHPLPVYPSSWEVLEGVEALVETVIP